MERKYQRNIHGATCRPLTGRSRSLASKYRKSGDHEPIMSSSPFTKQYRKGRPIAMGSKGGKAEAESMTARQRTARAKKAAAASANLRKKQNPKGCDR
jgi:hypothetical protein